MSYLRISKFWDYQNADAWKKAKANKRGHRHPAWCKLYVARDLEFDALPATTRFVFYELLRLATTTENVIPNDISRIAKAISTPTQVVAKAIPTLLEGAWLSETKTPRRSRKFRSQIEIEKEIENPPIVPPQEHPEKAQNGKGWVPNLAAYTGCRIVRGSHGFNYVYDTLGKERPPKDWPYGRPTKAEIAKALESHAA